MTVPEKAKKNPAINPQPSAENNVNTQTIRSITRIP